MLTELQYDYRLHRGDIVRLNLGNYASSSQTWWVERKIGIVTNIRLDHPLTPRGKVPEWVHVIARVQWRDLGGSRGDGCGGDEFGGEYNAKNLVLYCPDLSI